MQKSHKTETIGNTGHMSDAKRTMSEVELLYHTSRSIATAVDVDDVVAAYLDQVARGDRYACNLVLYNHDESGRIISRTARGTWNPSRGMEFLNVEQTYERDKLDDIMDGGETAVIDDVRSHPLVPEGLRQSQIAEGRLALAFLPLMASGKRLGVVVLSDEGPHAWKPEDLWPYQTTAAVLGVALESRIEAERSQERGRALAVLEERNRLARELHDSVTQMLFSVQLLAQTTTEVFERDMDEGRRRVERIVDLSGRALAEMRGLLNELRAAANEPKTPTLPTRLRAIANDIRLHGIEVQVQTDSYLPQDPVVEHELARIAQEAASNALKHSGASKLSFRLESARLTITDNGRGFAEAPGSGFGLNTMRERAESLGATYDVQTGKAGTTIRVELGVKDLT